MRKIGRNEPCPCGSGTKFKRCCGTREAQAKLERNEGALEELTSLAVLFPRLRPRGEAFAAWAARMAALDPDELPVDEGLSQLEPAELRRIERACAEEYPEMWASLVEELGDDGDARLAAARGAVAAGVWERRPPSPPALGVLAAWAGTDPAAALSYALDGGDLWSVLESALTDAALAEIDDSLDDEAYEVIWNALVAGQARRLATQWHRERLAELVGRLRSRLPFENHPAASAALARACEAFELDAEVRTQLSVLLLDSSLTRLRYVLPRAA